MSTRSKRKLTTETPLKPDEMINESNKLSVNQPISDETTEHSPSSFELFNGKAIREMSYNSLRSALKGFGLSSTGTKEELISYLINAVKNNGELIHPLASENNSQITNSSIKSNITRTSKKEKNPNSNLFPTTPVNMNSSVSEYSQSKRSSTRKHVLSLKVKESLSDENLTAFSFKSIEGSSSRHHHSHHKRKSPPKRKSLIKQNSMDSEPRSSPSAFKKSESRVKLGSNKRNLNYSEEPKPKKKTLMHSVANQNETNSELDNELKDALLEVDDIPEKSSDTVKLSEEVQKHEPIFDSEIQKDGEDEHESDSYSYSGSDSDSDSDIDSENYKHIEENHSEEFAEENGVVDLVSDSEEDSSQQDKDKGKGKDQEEKTKSWPLFAANFNTNAASNNLSLSHTTPSSINSTSIGSPAPPAPPAPPALHSSSIGTTSFNTKTNFNASTFTFLANTGSNKPINLPTFSGIDKTTEKNSNSINTLKKDEIILPKETKTTEVLPDTIPTSETNKNFHDDILQTLNNRLFEAVRGVGPPLTEYEHSLMTSLLKSTKPISSANSSQVNIEPNEQPLVPRSMPSNQNQGNGNVTNQNQNDLFATPFDGKPPSNQGLWSKSAQEIARGKLSSPSVINNRKSLESFPQTKWFTESDHTENNIRPREDIMVLNSSKRRLIESSPSRADFRAVSTGPLRQLNWNSGRDKLANCIPKFKQNAAKFSPSILPPTPHRQDNQKLLLESNLKRRSFIRDSTSPYFTNPISPPMNSTSLVAKKILTTLNEISSIDNISQSSQTNTFQTVKDSSNNTTGKSTTLPPKNTLKNFSEPIGLINPPKSEPKPTVNFKSKKENIFSASLDENIRSQKSKTSYDNSEPIVDAEFSFSRPNPIIEELDVSSVSNANEEEEEEEDSFKIMYFFSTPSKPLKSNVKLDKFCDKSSNVTSSKKEIEKNTNNTKFPEKEVTAPSKSIWEAVSDKWKCEVCMVFNEKTSSECVCCENPKGTPACMGDLIEASQSTASKPFTGFAKVSTNALPSSGTIGSSGFVFGVASSKPDTSSTQLSKDVKIDGSKLTKESEPVKGFVFGEIPASGNSIKSSFNIDQKSIDKPSFTPSSQLFTSFNPKESNEVKFDTPIKIDDKPASLSTPAPAFTFGKPLVEGNEVKSKNLSAFGNEFLASSSKVSSLPSFGASNTSNQTKIPVFGSTTPGEPKTYLNISNITEQQPQDKAAKISTNFFSSQVDSTPKSTETISSSSAFNTNVFNNKSDLNPNMGNFGTNSLSSFPSSNFKGSSTGFVVDNKDSSSKPVSFLNTAPSFGGLTGLINNDSISKSDTQPLVPIDKPKDAPSLLIAEPSKSGANNDAIIPKDASSTFPASPRSNRADSSSCLQAGDSPMSCMDMGYTSETGSNISSAVVPPPTSSGAPSQIFGGVGQAVTPGSTFGIFGQINNSSTNQFNFNTKPNSTNESSLGSFPAKDSIAIPSQQPTANTSSNITFGASFPSSSGSNINPQPTASPFVFGNQATTSAPIFNPFSSTPTATTFSNPFGSTSNTSSSIPAMPNQDAPFSMNIAPNNSSHTTPAFFGMVQSQPAIPFTGFGNAPAKFEGSNVSGPFGTNNTIPTFGALGPSNTSVAQFSGGTTFQPPPASNGGFGFSMGAAPSEPRKKVYVKKRS